jgi:hypothetical protein
VNDTYTVIFDGPAVKVIGSQQVKEFLDEERNRGVKKNVESLGVVLKRIADLGVQDVARNKEKLRHEGRFSSGNPSLSDIPVYAVKAFNLRIYGGLAQVDGKPHFVCLEAAKKKKDKANSEQLKRVAKAVGEFK